MGGEIRKLVYLDLFGAFEEPAEVVPEERCMADVYGADVCHLVESDDGDDVFVDELLLFVALAQAHEDLFALVHGIRRVIRIGSGFRETGGVGVEIAEHLLYKGLLTVGLLEVAHKTEEFSPSACEAVSGFLFVR